jgi:hypothetical protein
LILQIVHGISDEKDGASGIHVFTPQHLSFPNATAATAILAATKKPAFSDPCSPCPIFAGKLPPYSAQDTSLEENPVITK